MSISKAWASGEIDAAVGLYLIMRVLVARGEKFNKRALIREQCGIVLTPIASDPAYPARVDDAAPLRARSRQSVEMKLMNVTAVLHDIGRADLSMADHGYRPMNSYQAALKARVVELVDGFTLDDIDAVAVGAAS